MRARACFLSLQLYPFQEKLYAVDIRGHTDLTDVQSADGIQQPIHVC